MAREERELQKAYSAKEKYEKLLANLDALKGKSSVSDDQYTSMKTGYQKSQEQAIATINQLKMKIAQDIQSEETNIQRQNQELQNLDTRFKVGEIKADDLQKAEQRIRVKIQRSQAIIKDLNRLQTSQSSADVGGYIDVKTGTGSSSSVSLSDVSIPGMGHVSSSLRGLSAADFTEIRTDMNEILRPSTELIGPLGGVLGFISLFLPFASFFGFSASLISGSGFYGVLALIVTLAGIGSAFLVRNHARGAVQLAMGGLAFIFMILSNLASVVQYGLNYLNLLFALAGIGFYLFNFAIILMVIGGVIELGR